MPIIQSGENRLKKIICFDCNAKFENLSDLNRHIAKTGCNNTKPFSETTYLIQIATVLFLHK